MSIASEITRINTNIAAAYTACSNKGATMPQTQNSANLADTIDNIPGGGTAPEENDVNFYDYDGTLLYSYTKAEASALSALPALPSHDGLICQGWNYTLQQIREASGRVDVSCYYVTNDGSTKLYLFVAAGAAFVFPLNLNVAAQTALTVDWGDGTSSEVTNTDYISQNKNISHSYADPESDSVFCIRIIGGSFQIARPSQIQNNSLTLERVYLGSNCTAIGSYSFRYCYGLKSVSIPNSVTSISNNAFDGCYSIEFISIPDSVTTLGAYAFYNCYSLVNISIPNSITSINNNVFYCCSNLKSISIPDSVISFGSYVFYNCYSLENVTFSNSLTTMGLEMFSYCYALKRAVLPDSILSTPSKIFYFCKNLRKVRVSDMMTSISSEMFRDCSLLSSVTIPLRVGSIGSGAFYNCEHLTIVDLSAFTDPSHIPTLQSDAVNSVFLNSPAIFYVANAEMLSAFSAATNWSSLSSSRFQIKGA